MKIGTKVVIGTDQGHLEIAYKISQGQKAVIVDEYEHFSLVAFLYEDYETTRNNAIKGAVIEIQNEHLFEEYNPTKHAGFTIIKGVTILGLPIASGTNIQSAIAGIKIHLGELVAQAQDAYGWQNHSYERRDFGYTLKMVAEREFAKAYGYYAHF